MEWEKELKREQFDAVSSEEKYNRVIAHCCTCKRIYLSLGFIIMVLSIFIEFFLK